MDFSFKQFSLNHSYSALKIGTDAVLLGAWTEISLQAKNILDIGCGCGIIAMMLAQKSDCQVFGIDIHQPSIAEAKENAQQSKFVNRLHFQHISIQDFATTTTEKFDLIVSNPPFFDKALRSPVVNRNLSKHTQTLSFEELVHAVCQLLAKNGRFSLILPFSEANSFEQMCVQKGLFCQKCCIVYPKPNKNPTRAMLLFSFENKEKHIENLTIRDVSNAYMLAYKNLTKDFYLNF